LFDLQPCTAYIPPVAYLVFVSIVWSASFGIFKTQLSALDPALTAFLRLLLATLAFLPFLRLRNIGARARVELMVIGAIEYGAMYLMFNASFQYLDGWQVALMTLTTPLYIIAIDGIWTRSLRPRFVVAAVLAVAGGTLAMFRSSHSLPDSLTGALFVQGANLCFSLGQILYRRARSRSAAVGDLHLFALLYAGAVLCTGIDVALNGSAAQIADIGARQWLALIYMGIVSSGLCFFLWNLGATKVSAGTLAALNNLKVPTAIAVSILFFGENAGRWELLATGLAVMLAGVWIAERKPAPPRAT
jgi:drug/metabolite transporter (DMT)-like permease